MNIDRELAVYKLFTILLVKVLKLSCNEIKLFQVANMIVCQNVLTEMPKASHIVLPLFAFFVIHVPENVVVIAFYSIAISIKHMSITSNVNFVSETQYLKKL